MRLLLLTEFSTDFSTFRLTFENLARLYARRGHQVLTAGRRIPRGRADVVHLHTAGSWTPLLSDIADACLGRPLVVTFQDWDNPSLPLNDAAARRRWARLLSTAAAVTTVSRGVRDRLARAVPSAARRAQVIPNGVEESMFQPARRARKRAFILCPARLAYYKGIDLLLFAWKDACSSLDGVELVFCGPDHSRGRLQRLSRLLGLSSRTRFLGTVGRGTMRELMGSCLFAVLPSRHESFGIAALEAMAGGKAVLSTRTDGPSEVVIHGATGLLVEPNRVEPLRDGLLLLGEDSRLRDRMGQEGAKRADSFRWERIAESYLPLYAAGARS